MKAKSELFSGEKQVQNIPISLKIDMTFYISIDMIFYVSILIWHSLY